MGPIRRLRVLAKKPAFSEAELLRAISNDGPADNTAKAEKHYREITDDVADRVIRQYSLRSGYVFPGGAYRVVGDASKLRIEIQDGGTHEIGTKALGSYRATIDERRQFLRSLPQITVAASQPRQRLSDEEARKILGAIKPREPGREGL